MTTAKVKTLPNGSRVMSVDPADELDPALKWRVEYGPGLCDGHGAVAANYTTKRDAIYWALHPHTRSAQLTGAKS